MRLFLLLAGVVLAILAACSDDDGADPTPSAEPSGTAAATVSAIHTSSPAPAPTAVFTTASGETVELEVEIADDAVERQQGLMLRESLPENSGMIFIFDGDHLAGFWMKDTLIPLSIAFVTSDGTILDIQDMEPETLESHRPPDVYRNAIEVNQGWFDRNGIDVGDSVTLPEPS